MWGAVAATGISASLHKLDIQNSFKYANLVADELRKMHKSKTKIDEEFGNIVATLLDWEGVLGNGFTTWKPTKIKKYLDLFSSKKYHKLEKYVLKNYDDNNEMSDKELSEWIGEMLTYLEGFYQASLVTWDSGNKKELTKLDKDYYNYAKEQLDNMRGNAEEALEE